MERYRLRLFGGFHLSRKGRAVGLNSNKQRLLLAVVALSHPEAVPRPQLVDLLWGSRFDDQARQSLRQALSRLRPLLGGDELLVINADQVGLQRNALECDVHQFRRLVGAGDRDALRAAARLYQGELLYGISAREDGIERWKTAQAEELRELAVNALVSLAGAELAVGAHQEAILAAQRAVALDELREDAHRQLMSALAASGRRPDALRHARKLRADLRKELGTDVDERTREVIARLHAGDDAPPPDEGTSETADTGTTDRPGPAPGVERTAAFAESDATAAPIQQSLSSPGTPDAFAEHREITALSFSVEGLDIYQTDLDDTWELIQSIHGEVAQAVERAGGVVQPLPGAAGMAYFGYPYFVEDAPIDAVTAGLDILSRCSRLAAGATHADLSLHIGIATALAVAETPLSAASRLSIVGAAPALASALRDAAEANALVVCETTWKRARQRFRFRAAGPAGGQPETWRVIGPTRAVDRFSASPHRRSPLIGRAAELAIVLERWDRATAGRGQVILLEGEAGIGKSRLVREVCHLAGPGRHRLHMYQCTARSMDVMLHPIVNRITAATTGRRDGERSAWREAVQELLARNGIRDIEAISMLCFLVGADDAAAAQTGGEVPRLRERAIEAILRCAESLCEDGPALVVVEDIHWADPTTEDVLDNLFERIQGLPILMILTARSPKFEGWVGEANVTRLILNRLDLSDSTALTEAGWHGQHEAGIDPKLAQLIHLKTDGIPLFIEELTGWISEHLPAEGEPDWDALLAEAKIESVGSLLTARLGALGEARRVAQAAAVIGRSFSARLLSRILSPHLAEADVDRHLDSLVQTGVARRTRLGGATGYVFRHALIQKAAYESLLRKDRQTFHRQIFEAVASEVDAAVWMGKVELAVHAEQGGLMEQAVGLFIEAGRESSSRSAVAEAKRLLDHAMSLCGRLSDQNLQETLELSAMAALGPLLVSTEGSLPRARQLYEEAVNIARRRPESERDTLFPIYWGWWITGGNFGAQRERAAEVLNRFRDVPDPEIRLQAWHCVWAIDFNIGRHASCLEAIEQGLRLYQPGRGDETRILYGGHDARVCGLGQRALSLWLTGAGVSAIAAIEEARGWADEIRHVGSLAHVLDLQAMLQKKRRDYEALRTIAAEMEEFATEHSLHSLAAKGLIYSGWAEGKSGRAQEGRDRMQRGFDLLREIGTREDFPVYSEMLAELLAMCGEPSAGLALIAEAMEEAERADHRFWLPELHRRRARLLHQSGDRTEAAQALTAALSISAEQGANMLLLRASRSAVELGLQDAITGDYEARLQSALRTIEPDAEAAAAASEVAAALG